jgi:uncharacterized metal-binding protein YceD (DUF177 family)
MLIFTYLCHPLTEEPMSARREYEIAFVGLKPGLHEFLYTVDDKFFADRGQLDFTNVHAQVKLVLDKNTSFMLLKFAVGGKADVSCDRCGNPLNLNLWDDFEILVKMVDNPEEMNNADDNPDVFYISRTESHLHVADWVYEFVTLSVPTHRMCDEKEMGGPQCNKEVLAMLAKMKGGGEDAPDENPIWKGLDKFRNEQQ